MMPSRKIIFSAVVVVSTGVLTFGAAAALTGGSNQEAQVRAVHENIVEANASATVQYDVPVDGQRWSLKTYRDAEGQLCVAETVPGEGVGTACGYTADRMFANGRNIHYSLGARQRPEQRNDRTKWDNVSIWGFVHPSVKRLELLLTNCQRLPLHVNADGMYFHVVGQGMLHRQVWPHALIGYGASGDVLASETLPLTAPDPEPSQRDAPPGARGNCA